MIACEPPSLSEDPQSPAIKAVQRSGKYPFLADKTLGKVEVQFPTPACLIVILILWGPRTLEGSLLFRAQGSSHSPFLDLGCSPCNAGRGSPAPWYVANSQRKRIWEQWHSSTRNGGQPGVGVSPRRAVLPRVCRSIKMGTVFNASDTKCMVSFLQFSDTILQFSNSQTPAGYPPIQFSSNINYLE